jgi:hypothetical protein
MKSCEYETWVRNNRSTCRKLECLSQKSHLHLSPIFAGKTQVGSGHTCKFQARIKFTDSDKHSSLLRHRNNYGRKKFCGTGYRRKYILKHLKRRHDTQHNDIHHNDIHHNDTQHNVIQHNDTYHNGLICDSKHSSQLA